MVKNISSTHERVLNGIVKGLKESTGAYHTTEFNFESTEQRFPNAFDDPHYFIRIQDQPDTRRLPIYRARVYVNVGIKRTGGISQYDQSLRLAKCKDKITYWFRTLSSNVLNARAVTLINADNSIIGDALVALLQYEMIIFQIKGEY